MNDINALPDSLREQIQAVASGILPTGTMNVLPAEDPVKRILVEIARQSPELFVALIISSCGYGGIETIETEETTEERVVETFTRATGREWKVTPMKTQRTIRREVRFVSERSLGLRERR